MIKDKTILIRNVYTMLSYAFQALKRSEYKKLATENFEGMESLLAAVLAKGLDLQLKQGLCRKYIACEDDLTCLRGKLSMPSTIRNRLAARHRFACKFDELSVDNPLNRILKSTMLLLVRSPSVKEQYRTELKKMLTFFADISTVDLRSVRWSALRFQRSEQRYRMLTGICQLIAEGLLLTTDRGEMLLRSFLADEAMSRLYERFIREYYRTHRPDLNPRAAEIAWALDEDTDTSLLPAMRSDVHLQRGNTVLIIDAKYYKQTTQTYYERQTLHSQNMYQIFTYVKNRESAFGHEACTVSGLLLYAKTEGEPPLDANYKMSGTRIGAKTLDLSRPFTEISEQLDYIAVFRQVESNHKMTTKSV